MLQSTLLFVLAGLVAAQAPIPFNLARSPLAAQSNLALPGIGAETSLNTLNFARSTTCVGSEKACDGGCVSGTCCNKGNGAYCEPGFYCTSEGCCPTGESCSGVSGDCTKGKKVCGKFCVDSTAVCCDNGAGLCEAGMKCAAGGKCTPGSGGSGGSDGSSDSDDNSSGGGGGGTCYDFQEVCLDGCIPKGSVCCPNGRYCLAGQKCLSGNKCSVTGSDDSDDSDDSVLPTTTMSRASAPTPTGLRSGGGDDKPGAAAYNAPGLVGLLALVPLVL